MIGRRTNHFDVLESTNTHAASFAGDPANHGLVITADAQTAGRGQYDRTWSVPPGSSILMSVLLFPPVELRQPAILTAWAAVSVYETIRAASGLQATIKWPNDVLIGGKKVCGILCEAGAQHVVAGIGLNVNQSTGDFERLGLPGATSLAIEAGSPFDVPSLTKQLIQQFDNCYQRLVQGDIASLEAAWRSRIGLLGQSVVVERMDGGETEGYLIDLRFAGVRIAMAAGGSESTAPEAIRHLRGADAR